MKLRFLNTVASTYSLTVPAFSAHIMMMRATITDQPAIAESKNDVLNACKACGTVIISGVMSRTSINMGRMSRTANKGSKRSIASRPGTSVATEKVLETQCLSCHRVSKVAIPLSKRQASKSHARKTPQAPGKLSDRSTSENAASLPNVSSKQRTRARKNGGLQALVERSKETRRATSAFGLDLMDLMKEG